MSVPFIISSPPPGWTRVVSIIPTRTTGPGDSDTASLAIPQNDPYWPEHDAVPIEIDPRPKDVIRFESSTKTAEPKRKVKVDKDCKAYWDETALKAHIEYGERDAVALSAMIETHQAMLAERESRQKAMRRRLAKLDNAACSTCRGLGRPSSTAASEPPTEPPDDTSVGKPYVGKPYVDAIRADNFCQDRIFNAVTAAIEIASESSDVWFTMTTLAAMPDRTLYDVSVAFLIAQVVLRCLVGVFPLLMFPDVFGEGSNRWGLCLGPLLTLVSPINGVKVINASMALTPPDSDMWKAAEQRSRDLVNRAYQLHLALLCISVIQLAAEDVPELIIDIFFLYQANWTFGTGDLEIFVTTAALTLLSVTRALVQVCFALRNRARLPRVLDDDLSPMQQNLKWLTCCCPKQKTDWDKLTLGKLKVQKVDPQLRKYTSVVHLCRDTSEKKPRTELFMDKQRRMVELEPWKWIGLKALTLDKCSLNEEHGKAIAKVLAGPTAIAILSLIGNSDLADETGKLLAGALKANASLEILLLGRTGVTDKSGELLAQALKTNKTLKVLSLNRTKVTDKTGKALARMLETNRSLIELRFNAVPAVSNNTGIELAKALKINKTLQVLSIEWNNMGDLAGVPLAKALGPEQNQSLKMLKLTGTKVTDETGQALAQMLRSNTSLTELYLGDNQGKMTNITGTELVKALKKKGGKKKTNAQKVVA